jgi:hypothetical protein
VTIALKLTHDEPRLVFLALVYHLGRPGSELDPETMQPHQNGLRAIKVALGRDLTTGEAVVELDNWQLQRLSSAIRGCVTELRVYHMREGASSGVEAWTETAESLFPAIRQNPEAALDLAESIMMLQRRIDRAVTRIAAEPAEVEPRKKRRWPLGKA